MIIIAEPTPDPDIPQARHPAAVKMLANKYLTERNIEQLRDLAPDGEKGADLDSFTHSNFFQEHVDKMMKLEKADPQLSLPALHAVVIGKTRREMLNALASSEA